MNDLDRAAYRAHQPRGRLLRVCVILVLTAVWLAPPPAATANTRRPQETEETPQATIDCLSRDSLRPDAAPDPNSDFQHCIDAGNHPITSVQSEASDSAPAVAPAVPDLGYWAAGFGPMGVGGRVSALAVGGDGSLYVGGNFATAGDTLANRIARWDGTVWHPLGSGMDGDVYALAVALDGSLYAGGLFTTAGGVAADHVARWDGTAWRTVGSGISGDNYPNVRALAFGPDGSLYAGGRFTTAGGVAANGIARWDGTAWHPLGSGMSLVYALAFGPDGSLYAGGAFTTAGGVAANYIARWDGTTWHGLGSGISGGDYPYVHALAFGPDGSLYAGGQFTSAGGVAANHIARWDGTAWHPLGSGMGGSSYPVPRVFDLAVGLGGSLYAGGLFTTAGGVTATYIARWDGTAWRPLGSGANADVLALALGPNGTLYVGGVFSLAGEVAASAVARWDQTTSSWHTTGGGNGMGFVLTPGVEALVSGPDGSLYAGGYFNSAGGVAANAVARWDGTTWHPLGSGTSSAVMALASGPDGSLYAGGGFTMAGGVAANRIARWDGTAWHPLGSGMGPDYSNVYALAFGADGSLYAGGDFSTAGGMTVNSIARWDGTAWHALGSGIEGCPYDGCVRALTFGPDGSLYAGGWFTIEGGIAANNIARWDGAAWYPLGTGMSAPVSALAFGPDGSLYAGGWFVTAGGVAVNHIARWDGTTWHPIGNGVNGDANHGVWALAFGPDGSLYAGGQFTTAGGSAASSIARWDGSAWHPLGNGMEGCGYLCVHSLAIGRDGSLYAGGSFTLAGGRPSSSIAKWIGEAGHRTMLPLVIHSR